MKKEMDVVKKNTKPVKRKPKTAKQITKEAENANKAKKISNDVVKLPISHTVIISVLALVMGMGGTYAGKYVYDSPRVIVSPGPGYDQVLHTVTRVIDSDTFVVDNDGVVIRMLGIDAPEKEACFFEEANTYATELLLGKQVVLVKDSQSLDDFGRLLRYVFIYDDDARHDNLFVNHHLIKQGYAYSEHLGNNRQYEPLLNVAMGQARKANRGLHAVCVNREDVIVEPQSDECLIKGNINTDKRTSIYYLSSCPNYGRVLMKERDDDQYFCTEQEAIDAGFAIAGNCKTQLNLEPDTE